MRKEVLCKHTQLLGKKQSSDTYPLNIFRRRKEVAIDETDLLEWI